MNKKPLFHDELRNPVYSNTYFIAVHKKDKVKRYYLGSDWPYYIELSDNWIFVNEHHANEFIANDYSHALIDFYVE